MFIARILQPAISIINKLTFKYKILMLISILLTLLILPSITYINSFTQKNELFNQQKIALSYITQLHNLITQLQMHRGLTNGYLSANLSFKEEILELEPKIIQNLQSFSRQNQKVLKKIHAVHSFSHIHKEVKSLLIKNIQNDRYPTYIFQQHTEVINKLIRLLQKIGDSYKLGLNDNVVLKHMAKILTDKLVIIQENTAILRGLATAMFEQENIQPSERNKLLALYAHINTLQQDPLQKETLKYLSQFPDIKKLQQLMKYRLNNLIYIVRYHLLIAPKPSFDAKHFFNIATDTILTQDKLYNKLTEKYRELLHTLHEKHLRYTMALTLGFFIILLVVLYLATAFYYSVTRSIKKLKTASTMIAKGNTKITLTSDTEDEVSEALAAFTHVGNKLGENISFLNSYKTAIDETSIVSKTDKRGIITYANKKFCSISGFSEEELLGKPHNIVRHPDMPKKAFKEMWDTIKSGNIWQGIVKNRKKDGDFYIVDTTVMPIFDANGAILEYIAIRHDITELEKSRKKIQEEMQKQKIDALTQLPNKIQLLQDIKACEKPVLLYLNINEFANLNDFYGTRIGDKVLRYVANLLKKKVSKEKIHLYKLSSDTFILLYDEKDIVKNPEQYLNDIIEYIEYETSICPEEECVSVTVSGGIATYHDAHDERLISYASMARKFAKKDHKSFLRYSNELNKDVDYEKNIAWINKIKDAIAQDRITAFYQPIVDNRTGEISKYETLMRLVEKNGKVISPFFFLDIAKKAKLYTKLTKIIFDKAFATFEKEPQLEFSVNISIEDIEDEDICMYIFEKLRHFPHPHRVILEITEDQEIKNYDKINNFIATAKKLGAKIAIDDFGSGYANFDHIIKLNADFIKIDGSLIKNIDTDKESLIITQAIIAFSKKLGSKTVVEFVHNETIHEIVCNLGAEYSQGYHLGEPSAELKKKEPAFA